MPKTVLSARDLIRGKVVNVPTDEPTLVVVQPFMRWIVEMEDANFHFDSAVLLPEHPEADGASDAQKGATPTAASNRIGGLDVLRIAYQFASDHPDRKLLVAGHTDTTGDPEYNLSLSQLRAQSVLYALVGDRDKWAAVSQQKSQVADYQLVLKWVDEYFGWGCDPGAVDNQGGPATRAAVRRFQQEYGSRTDTTISVDGDVGPETWKAFFDLYMIELAVMMKTDADGLAKARGKLTFLDPGNRFVGCGQAHPLEGPSAAAQLRSVADRRVELLFFEPGKEPKLACHPAASQCNPAVCEVYDGHVFQIEPIPVAPLDAASSIAYWLRSNSGCVPLAQRAYTVDVDGQVLQGTTDGDGLVQHDDLPAGDWVLTTDGHTTRLATLPKGAAPRVQVVVGYRFVDEGD